MMFRPLTIEDYRAFYNNAPFSIKGIAAELNGKLVGVGGLYYEKGRRIVFSSFCDSLTKRQIVKGARAIMQLAASTKGPVYAYPEGGERAERTLAHFGFVPLAKGYWVRHG